MTKVEFTGWNEGFNKVGFNQFLRDRCGLSLAEAKAVVDQVLQNERVELECQHISCSDEQRIVELGVRLE